MVGESLAAKIDRLKEKHNAVILVHNYQRAEVQDIADYIGDSLGLSIQASETKADVIVFCGVHFMAETAAILCPDKKVIMPEPKAGCPMADMIDMEGLRRLKSANPDAQVVCYVNSTAEIKAESDICCTSANAVDIVKSLTDAKDIIFIPDQYLGSYTASRVKNKNFIFWQGYCPTHAMILPEHIQAVKNKYPNAKVMVHPECLPETIDLADEVLSTGGMIRFARESEAKEYIVGTETGIIYRLEKENPEKSFYPVMRQAVCPNMKMTTLEKVFWSLQDLETEIKVNPVTAERARAAIQRMLDAGRK